MADENTTKNTFTIEKTNFPGVVSITDPLGPSYDWHFTVTGEAANSFIQAAVNNSYCNSYSCNAQRADGKSLTAYFMQTYFHNEDYLKPALWDTFKNKKVSSRPCQALIVAFKRWNEKHIASLFDSIIPLCFKSVKNLANQWIIVRHIDEYVEDNFKGVPDEFIKATAEYIGASMIVRHDNSDRKLSWEEREKSAQDCFQQIAVEMPEAVQYTDNTRTDIFSNLAKIRYGTLDDVKNMKWPGISTFQDPMKNSVLHLALSSKDTKVFLYLAEKYPELINKKNIFGSTPLHILPYLYQRLSRPIITNWKSLWKLPISFSVRNEDGKTCLESIVLEPYAVEAFTALIKNEKKWTEARKHHKRKKVLTTIMHEYIKKNADEKKLMFFIENGASIHHHEGKSLLNSAIRSQRVDLTTKLIDIGSKLTADDIVIGYETKNTELIRYLVKRPEFDKCSQQQLGNMVQIVINIGLTDVLKYLVKKGCKTGLSSINQKAMLTTANLIAQMNRSTVMPLKYLCVDAISESFSDQKEMVKMLETYPEEIRYLFPKKELWRWALMMDEKDSDRQRRILNLYEASNRAIQKAEMWTVFKVGSTEFSITREEKNWKVWYGSDDSKDQPHYNMYYEEFYEYIGSSGHADTWSRQDEKGQEVLADIMKDCGWHIEDKYLFLLIINTCNNYFWQWKTEVDLPLVDNLFCIWLNRFMQPPQWYTDFILETYGVTNPPVPPLD